MSLLIPTPDSDHSEIIIPLGGTTYYIEYQWHEIPGFKRWRVSFYDNQRNPLVLGVPVVGEGSLLGKYRLSGFAHGDIFCIKLSGSNRPLSRQNLGFNKDYCLVYVSNEELEDV